MIGVKSGQVIHRGLKVRLDEVRSSDRGFRNHEIVSKGNLRVLGSRSLGSLDM